MDFKSKSVQDLFKELSNEIDRSADSVKRACDILYELRNRGEHHPFMRDGVFRWYQEISTGRLSPKVALTFAGLRTIVSCLLDLPFDEQERIASGGKIEVVEITNTREIVIRPKPILTMRSEELERIFTSEGILPVKQQEKLIRSQLSSPTPVITFSRVKADLKEGKLIIGNTKLDPEDLREALKALGFKLSRTNDTRLKSA